MAPKDPAPSAKDDIRDATVASHTERDGQHYPALRLTGEAPRKGSSLRVRLDNGTVYSAKVHGSSETEDGLLVETEGLTPEAPERPVPPPSDIVDG